MGDGWTRRATVWGLLWCLVLVSACSGNGGAAGPTPASGGAGSTATEARTAANPVALRPLHASKDLRVVDDQDRDVLLRGANITSLGEYWQGDKDHPPTLPTTDADWAAMQAHGLSVVRLIITWSRVEPERGRIDNGYLDQIDGYVKAAAAHGIYTVIDMHQDAFSSFISTKDASECAAGTEPGKGWDGAPKWATLTNGANTCITRERNDSPAVVAAWNNFYDNTDGIRDRFAASWGAVAARFAGRAEIAGFDLLNEPEVSRPGAELTPKYDELVKVTVIAIREAQAAAKAPFEHLIFVEPAIPAANPGYGIVIPDPKRIGMEPKGIVAGPHNYAESIQSEVTIDSMNNLFLSASQGLGVPLWVGEYGFWDTKPETLAKVKRFAADQDRLVLGGAWWQWRQPCGDPHSIKWGGWAVMQPEVSNHLNKLQCPGGKDLGPTDEFLSVLGRAYPRAAPGRIKKLTSDPISATLAIEADGAPTGIELVVWTPTAAHKVTTEGLRDVKEQPVGNGRIITATTTADHYRFELT